MDDHTWRRDPWVWVGALSAAAFLLLALVVIGRGGLPFDDPFTAAVKALPLPVAFWEVCTSAGGPFLVLVEIALVLVALLTRHIRLAIILAAILIGASIFTDVMKNLIERPRPPGDALAPWLGYSFPSGHALNSTVTYGLLAVVAWRSRLPELTRSILVAIGVAVPILVGLSRVALGVHFPSDVLAGWLAGVAFVALGACLIRAFGAMEVDRRPTWKDGTADAGDPV